MPSMLDISSLPFGWVAALVVVSAPLGAIGYIFATRRVKQPLVAFLARYAISFLLFFFFEAALLALSPSVHATLRDLTATLAGGLLGTAGVSESVSGSLITVRDPFLLFSIDASCLGGLLFWSYIALVLAESRASNKQRTVGLLIGLAILVGFNYFRIVWSIYLEWLTDVHVHDYFYFVNMLVVLLVWAGWLRTLGPRTATPAMPTPSRGYTTADVPHKSPLP